MREHSVVVVGLSARLRIGFWISPFGFGFHGAIRKNQQKKPANIRDLTAAEDDFSED